MAGEVVRRQQAQDLLDLMDFKIYGHGDAAPAAAGPLPTTTRPADVVFVPGAGFQLARAAEIGPATTVPPPPPPPQQQQHQQPRRRWPSFLLMLMFPWLPILLLILTPLLLPPILVTRLLYRRHLAYRRAAARLLSRPLTASQAQLLLGARPLWVPPRALAPDDGTPSKNPTVDESLGWLNSLLEQLWPALDSAAAAAVAQAVQPLLDAARPPFVRALGFERLTLGALPLRIDRLRLIDPASPPAASGGAAAAATGGAVGGGVLGGGDPGVAVEADVAWAGHANVSFFVDLVAPAGGGGAAEGGAAPSAAGAGALLRLAPRVEDLGLRGTLRVALSPAHPASSSSSSQPPTPKLPLPFAPAPPPLPAALVVSFSRPPTVKFSLKFARALALPAVVGSLVEPPVQAFLDGALRQALVSLLVWPQRVVLPLTPLLRPLLPSLGGGGIEAAAATKLGLEEEAGDEDAPPDGLLDEEDAALDALHLRSVGLLRVEALGVRRGDGSATADLPGTGLGQRLELELWTDPTSRARLTVPTDGKGAATAGTATVVPPPAVATVAAAAAGPGAATATSGGALPSPSAGGEEAPAAAAELLVQEPRSQRARLVLRVADTLAAPRALLRGDIAASAAALFGGAEQRRSARVGRASLPLVELVAAAAAVGPSSASEGAAAAAQASTGARATEAWFALSPADEDWEDIEQTFERVAGAEGGEEEEEEDEDEGGGASTATATAPTTTTTTTTTTTPAATAAASAAAAAASASSGQPPLQLRLRLTYLPLLPPTPGSPVPARGGVLRVAVRRARRLPPLPGGGAAAAHFAVVDVGPLVAASSPSSSAPAAAGPPDPSSRRRETPPSPPSRAPAFRCRFEFGGCSLADAVRVRVLARREVAEWGWGAVVPLGEVVVSLGALLGLNGVEGAAGGESGGGGASAVAPWPSGEWLERRLGAAEGWADLAVGGSQVLLRLEYTSAGEAAAALAAA